jgi:hypothetical protein
MMASFRCIGTRRWGRCVESVWRRGRRRGRRGRKRRGRRRRWGGGRGKRGGGRGGGRGVVGLVWEGGSGSITCMVAKIGEWNWSLLYMLALLASWWYSTRGMAKICWIPTRFLVKCHLTLHLTIGTCRRICALTVSNHHLLLTSII